jgi:hypothetical protein
LVRGGKPLRVVDVGQEYGQAPTLSVSAHALGMVVDSGGRQVLLEAEPGLPARNPHTRDFRWSWTGTSVCGRLQSVLQPVELGYTVEEDEVRNFEAKAM